MSLWLAIMIIGASVATAYGGEIRHTVQLDPESITADTVTSPDGTSYIRLSAPDCQYIGKPGEPMLPYKIVRFLVPTYSNNYSVEIENKTIGGTMSLSLPLYPIQQPVSYNDYTPDMFTQPDFDSYATDINPAVVVNDYVVNGNQRIVSVGIATALTHESATQIDMLTSLSFKLKYSECTAEELDFIPISSPASSLDMDLNGYVVNPPANSRKALSGRLDQNDYYLILVPEYLKESIHDLAMWKRQKGYKVEIKTVEEIRDDKSYDLVNGHESFDLESHVRNWLIAEAEKKGVFHLLIIGDDKAGAPIRKFRWKSKPDDPYSFEYNGAYFSPTDGYFSDVTSKFILDESIGKYYVGETYKQPVAPCLPVGRILANKDEELKRYLKKTLIYENDPGLGDSAYLGHAAAFFQYDMRREVSMIPYISNLDVITYLEDQQNNDTFDENRPTGKEVIDVFKTCGIMSMHGHGSPMTIRCSGKDYYQNHRYIVCDESYGTSDTGHINTEIGNGYNSLNNPIKPAIAYSIGCEICPFEKMQPSDRTYRDGLYNMGSGFTVAGDYGGVAFIGNTRDGFVESSDKLEQLFGRFIDEGNDIGNAIVNSTLSSTQSKHCKFTRCLIGTPDIKIWLGVPKKFDAEIIATRGQLDITGNDLGNSKIVIYNGNDVLISQNLKSSNSLTQNLLNLEKEYGKDYVVSLYKDGRLPLTYLIANESVVSNESKSYFFRDADIHNSVEKGKRCFSVTEGGRLDITCTRGLKSKKAFGICLGGVVNIKSMSRIVALSGDKVDNRGTLNISAQEVTLDNDFTVNEGGVLEITINK